MSDRAFINCDECGLLVELKSGKAFCCPCHYYTKEKELSAMEVACRISEKQQTVLAEAAEKYSKSQPAGIHLTVEELEGMKRDVGLKPYDLGFTDGRNALIDELIERAKDD